MIKNFKKDIVNYSLSVIIPASINFLTIPLIKWFLGAENYGQYGLWYGGFLVFLSGVSGWLGICIVRFRPEFENVDFLYKHLSKIIGWLVIICGLVGFIYVSSVSKNILFALIYSLALIGAICQNSIMAVSQANFLSRYTVYSEGLRMITFLCSYTLLLWLGKAFFLEKIFFSLLLSYASSFFFLISKNKISLKKIEGLASSKKQFPYKSFLKFGFPLVLWYLFAAIIPYTDKLLVAEKFGHGVQGNYQAIFDLIYRAVGIVFAPVLIASFPYLSQLYTDGHFIKAMQLIKKLLLIELGIMLACLVVYALGAGKLLIKILGIESTSNDYLLVGAIIITVAFIWQMAMLLHKPFELMKKTNLMLINNFIALIATLIPLWYIYNSNWGFIAYPIGILCGAVSYSLLCIFQIRGIIKKGGFL